jgi:hypothetical protein
MGNDYPPPRDAEHEAMLADLAAVLAFNRSQPTMLGRGSK